MEDYYSKEDLIELTLEELENLEWNCQYTLDNIKEFKKATKEEEE